jgi:hypothetical protein
MLTTETSYCLARSGPDRIRWSGLSGSIERARSSDLYIPRNGETMRSRSGATRSRRTHRRQRRAIPYRDHRRRNYLPTGGQPARRQSPRSAPCVGAPDCPRSASGGTEPLVGTTSHEHRRHPATRRARDSAPHTRHGNSTPSSPLLNTTGHGRGNRQAGRGRRPVQADPLVVRPTARSSIAAPVGRGDDAPQTTAAVPAPRQPRLLTASTNARPLR